MFQAEGHLTQKPRGLFIETFNGTECLVSEIKEGQTEE